MRDSDPRPGEGPYKSSEEERWQAGKIDCLGKKGLREAPDDGPKMNHGAPEWNTFFLESFSVIYDVIRFQRQTMNVEVRRRFVQLRIENPIRLNLIPISMQSRRCDVY